MIVEEVEILMIGRKEVIPVIGTGIEIETRKPKKYKKVSQEAAVEAEVI